MTSFTINQFKRMTDSSLVLFPCQNPPQQCRTLHLLKFFSVKEKVCFLTRQTLFLAIAVFDKYCEKAEGKVEHLETDPREVELRVATCLWVAWKFNEVAKMPVRRLFDVLSATDIDLPAMADCEADILQTIDFQIPIEIPYFQLTTSFDAQMRTLTDSMLLVGQCLAFLKEAILFSKDFSLQGHLGRHILALYTTKRFEDERVREVYWTIKRKREEERREAIMV